jgi:hypothetical protein
VLLAIGKADRCIPDSAVIVIGSSLIYQHIIFNSAKNIAINKRFAFKRTTYYRRKPEDNIVEKK